MPRIGDFDRTGPLSHLQQTLARLNQSQTQLATGSRLNRAADDPAGLVLAERLSAEVRAISQSIESHQRTGNLFDVAEGGLSAASGLLTRARSLAVQAQDGALSAEEREQLQGELDSTLNELDRIGNATTFAGDPLLSGARDFSLANVNAAFQSVSLRQVRFADGGGPVTVSVNVTRAADEAQASGAIDASQAAAATFSVSGSLGNATVSVAAGATRAEVAQAINNVRDATGVEADETTGVVTSTEVGSESFVRIENVEGTLSGVAEGRTEGVDVAATVNGVAAAGRGNTLTVSSADGLAGNLTLREGTGTGAISLQVTGGGLALPGAQGDLRTAFPSIRAETLGLRAGAGGLSSLRSGGANSLLSNPAGAGRILEAAVDDLSRFRGSLGGIQRSAIEGGIRSLQTRLENTRAAESRVRDADFARATADFTRDRILYQGQIAMLRQSHALAAQQVLSVLGG